MALDLSNWSQARGDQPRSTPEGWDAPKDQEPFPGDEPFEGSDAMEGKTPNEMDQLILLARMHLPEIEAQIHDMIPEVLLNDEVELPEDHADQILEMVDLWRDGLPELLSGISPDEALAVQEGVQNEIVEVEPILVGAWLWRAGQLTTPNEDDEGQEGMM